MKSLSHVRLFVTPGTVAYQAPPSMEFSRQEYWSGLPFPSPRNLPSIGIEPTFPELRMGGSVVEFSPVMREAQVYFLAHAATVTPFWASLVAQLVKKLPAMRETCA